MQEMDNVLTSFRGLICDHRIIYTCGAIIKNNLQRVQQPIEMAAHTSMDSSSMLAVS